MAIVKSISTKIVKSEIRLKLEARDKARAIKMYEAYKNKLRNIPQSSK